MQKDLSLKYSPLFDRLSHYLFQHQKVSKELLERQVISEPLILSLMEYRSFQFVTDLHHSIQLVIPNPNIQQKTGRMEVGVSPINFIEGQEYQKLNQEKYNFWQPYNCNKEQLLNAQSMVYPHPYSPEYFMGDYFDEFKKKKALLKTIYLKTKIIRIYQWRIKIVNVSKTGWYAPVIEAVHHKIQSASELRKENVGDLCLILYESSIKELMQRMRIEDWKQLKKDHFDKSKFVSLTYYLKEDSTESKVANIVKVDKRKQILTFKDENRLAYISFGAVEGSAILTEKVDLPPIDTKKLKEQKIKDWQILYNAPEKKRLEVKAMNTVEHQLLCWSDEECSQQSPPYGFGPDVIVDEKDEVEESDQDEDVLKRLYAQQLNFSMMRIL